MPQTRGKNSKSKKLSLQRVKRSKDKTDKSSNMDSNTGYNNKILWCLCEYENVKVWKL